MSLVKIQPVIDVISLSLQSAFIADELNAISLILIGPPEVAKTSSIFKFNNLKFVNYYDEITAKKIMDEVLPEVKSGKTKFLLVPDLINCIEKQRATREQFLAILKSGIDDTGIMRISTAYKQLPNLGLVEGLKFSLITATTIGNFKSIRKSIKSSGLMSRLLPFSYTYSQGVVRNVFDLVNGENVSKTDNVVLPEIRQPEKPVKIRTDPALLSKLEMVSTQMGIAYGGYGIRAHMLLKRLTKANALINDRDHITKEDINRVIELSNWMNFDCNPL